jgi:hypothetical protein
MEVQYKDTFHTSENPIKMHTQMHRSNTCGMGERERKLEVNELYMRTTLLL